MKSATLAIFNRIITEASRFGKEKFKMLLCLMLSENATCTQTNCATSTNCECHINRIEYGKSLFLFHEVDIILIKVNVFIFFAAEDHLSICVVIRFKITEVMAIAIYPL